MAANAPLLPVAVAVLIGLAADRYFDVSLVAAAAIAAAAVGGWTWSRRPALLWLAWAALAAASHHDRHMLGSDDVGRLADDEPRLVRLRGTLRDAPIPRRRPPDDPLRLPALTETTAGVLDVSEAARGGDWQPAGGRARLSVAGPLDGLKAGDAVEVVGWLTKPAAPANPGEFDSASLLRDRGIAADLRVRTGDGVVRIGEVPAGVGLVAAVRAWGRRTLAASLTADADVAAALLLGDEAALSSAEWEKYARTGVVHVLAVSGQHLVVLGGCVWVLLRRPGDVGRRPAALAVAGLVAAYAAVTGGRASAVRASAVVAVACGAAWARRPLDAPNGLAASALVVVAFDPTDPFTAGFQLSFVATAVLVLGVRAWFPPRELTPVEELVAESRSPAARLVRSAVRATGQAYLVSLVIGVAVAPLVLSWQNLVSPVGILIGPLAVLLTSVALLAGFAFLVLAAGGLTVGPLAWATGRSLAGCDALVAWADALPFGTVYAPAPPLWWLAGWYALGAAWLLRPTLTRKFLPGLLAWTCLGLLVGSHRPTPDGLRVTFLAVGHGGCAVLECPDGRVLLYDAGAASGPDVVRRSRGPVPVVPRRPADRRGVPLARRPRPFQRPAGVARPLRRRPGDDAGPLLAEAERGRGSRRARPEGSRRRSAGGGGRRGVRGRGRDAGGAAPAGRLGSAAAAGRGRRRQPVEPGAAGDARGARALADGRSGGAGPRPRAGFGIEADRCVDGPAPRQQGGQHAGVRGVARPRLAVVCRGPRDADPRAYPEAGVPAWGTWPLGAVTIGSHRTGIVAEAFATKQRLVVRAGR